MSRDGSRVLSRRHTSLLMARESPPPPFCFVCVQAFLVALVLVWTFACMLMFGHALLLVSGCLSLSVSAVCPVLPEAARHVLGICF